jgi:hypothetical protein
LNRVAFEARITEDTGPITLEAEVQSPVDPFPNNNRFRESIVVQGRPKILYVEGRRESARYLKDALTLEGFTVETALPNSIPTRVDQLDAYDAIVLSDVARSNISERPGRKSRTRSP